MKVLVTGGTGFLGRHVLRSLATHGIECVVIGRTPVPGHPFLACDLLAAADHRLLLASARATHLLHLAWYTEPDRYWTSPLNLRWVDASLRLIEAFHDAGGQHVVVAGSCAEYDWAGAYCREDAPTGDPASLYGVAKDALRRMAIALADARGFTVAWGRVFQPFGPGEHSRRLIPSLIDIFLKKRPPIAVNADIWRDFIYAADVAEAFVTLLRHGSSGVWNISTGQPIQIAAVVTEIARLCGADPRIVLDLPASGRTPAPLLVGDNRKLAALGWTPTASLTQGLTRMLPPAATATPNRRART